MVSLTPSFYLLAPYGDATAGLVEERLSAAERKGPLTWIICMYFARVET